MPALQIILGSSSRMPDGSVEWEITKECTKCKKDKKFSAL